MPHHTPGPAPLLTQFCKDAKITVPLVCGAMYPCSNPELVAAVSEAGGIGIVQPISLVYVHGYEFKAGLDYIKTLTDKPFGVNIITEKTAKIYQQRMERYVDMALEHGVRFFVTSLGNPRWVVDRVSPYGGVVYHDVTERKWAQKALDAGVHGLIAVNGNAGGHAGSKDALRLIDELSDCGVPILCAGGVGDEQDFVEALNMGYAGVQLGTRFIATLECKAHHDYKRAIVTSSARDIVLTERISGVPVAVIKTPYVEQVGLHTGYIARYLLKGRRTKHWMRTLYALRSVWSLKRGLMRGLSSKDYWQAGKSVQSIHSIEPAGQIVQKFARARKEDYERRATTVSRVSGEQAATGS